MKKRAKSITIKEGKRGTKHYTVAWQEANGEERRTKSCEPSRPTLEAYLSAMAAFIPWITTIPEKNIAWAEIAGAKFNYSPTTGMAYLSLKVAIGVKAGMSVDNCFGFTTPELPVDLDHANTDNPTSIAEKFTGMAKLLHDEILLYADGYRAQMSLFDKKKTAVENDEQADYRAG